MPRTGRRTASVLLSLVACVLVAAHLVGSGSDRSLRSESRARIGRSPHTDLDPTGFLGSEVKADEPASGRIKITVRDLGTGAIVEGVGVSLIGAGTLTSATTDAEGCFEFERHVAPHLAVLDEGWIVGSKTFDNALRGGTLWVYRLACVRGRLRAADDAPEFNPQSATVRFLLPPREGDVEGREMANYESPSQYSATPSPDGAFELTVPHGSSVTIAASARGWRAASATVHLEPDGTHAPVELVLERGYRIRGTMLSSLGHVLKNVEVTAYVPLHLTPSEASVHDLLRLSPEGGITSIVEPLTKIAHVKYQFSATTDEDGVFDIALSVNGPVVLVSTIRGHRPVERELGVTSSDVSGLELVAEHVASEEHVVLAAGGRILRRVGIVVADLSLGRGEIQHATRWTTDDEGRIPATWLLKGRAYYFGTDDARGGNMFWDGRERVDLVKDMVPFAEIEARVR